MFSFLRRTRFVPFNIRTIGDRWTRRSINHKGRDGDLHVRMLPEGLAKGDYRFVALVQPDQSVAPGQYDQWTGVVQRSLEAEGKGLLVVTHLEPSQITWYAYSSTREALDETLYLQRQSHPLRWGINEDARWEEYDFSRKLAGV